MERRLKPDLRDRNAANVIAMLMAAKTMMYGISLFNKSRMELDDWPPVIMLLINGIMKAAHSHAPNTMPATRRTSSSTAYHVTLSRADASVSGEIVVCGVERDCELVAKE